MKKNFTFCLDRNLLIFFILGVISWGVSGEPQATKKTPEKPTHVRWIDDAASVAHMPIRQQLPAQTQFQQGSPQQWVTLLSEDLESPFPETHNWQLLWSSDTSYTWDEDDFRPHGGRFSAWCAAWPRPSQPDLDPAFDDYPNDLNSWMIWGPFSLEDAVDAEFQFWYWNESETDFDFFGYGVSTDGNQFFGVWDIDGSSNGWQFVNLQLSQVPGSVDFLGQPQVWIAFNFNSDEIISERGAFVDDILLRKELANAPPVVAHSPVSLDTTGTAGRISATITDDQGVMQATLHYRMGGESAFRTSVMSQNGNRFVGSIPATEVTPRGLEYFIEASDGQFQTYDPPTNWDTEPHIVRTFSSNLTNPTAQPGGSEQTAFRMISVPGEINNPEVNSVFFDDLGDYNNIQWRFFRYEADNYHEYPDTRASSISPGQAYWLIVREAGKQVDAGPAHSVTTGQSFSITLQPGWNDIGLPFHFPVNWSDVQNVTQDIDGPYAYEGNWLLPNSVSQLLPWKGYAVNNQSNQSITIEIPARAAAALPKASNPDFFAGLKGNAGEWYIQLKAYCQDAADTENYLGIRQDGTSSKDRFDYSEPPPIGEFVSLYFDHENSGETPARLAADFRSANPQNYRWNFTLETNITNSPIEIICDGVTSLPDDVEIIVVDPVSGNSIDMRRQSRMMYLNSPQLELQIFAGERDFVAPYLNDGTNPKTFKLFQNYPNPFNPATTISYEIPRTVVVRLGIYNLLGQKIKSLINESKKPGLHSVVWDGTTDMGEPATSGVYLYRIKAGKFVQSRKLLLLR